MITARRQRFWQSRRAGERAQVQRVIARRNLDGGPPMTSDILIIGAGVAGLFTALKLAPRAVTVVTARPLGKGGSSGWAQGGIAAAVAPGDSPALHLADTIAAGAGLVDDAAAQILCEEGPARIGDLIAYGVPFDRHADGSLKVGREAAHGRDRIVHASGDQAGAAIMAALIDAARAAPHITIIERVVVEDLLVDEHGAVSGALAFDIDRGVRELLHASATILATGGLGGLYAVTTNPVRAQGHGLSFAARAGAIIRDPEFVQFHPTAIDIGVDPAPLATEALRGEGATLVNRDGRRFMPDYHPDAELAPRDIVARAVEAERNAGRGALLDATRAIGDAFPERFPTVYGSARAGGVDPRVEPLPVAPASHYHMGGVLTDAFGRSSVPGLWAIGEVASTGVHGANRLASNSLLEAVVFGGRAAQALLGAEARQHSQGAAPADRFSLAPQPADPRACVILRHAMSSGCALLRSRASLLEVRHTLDQLSVYEGLTSGLLSAIVSARLIVEGALAREESRGGHYRTDFPDTAPAQLHSLLRLAKGASTPSVEFITAAPSVSHLEEALA